jgi:dual specificity phosphatase 3
MSLPSLRHANAHFVTPQLLVGGDLSFDESMAAGQLEELVAAGVTHIVDVRVEADDAHLVARLAPEVGYLHHGIDDAGQRVAGAFFDTTVGYAVEAIDEGGVVLAHCHMGINRGPSLGFAILLHQGWDPVEALSAIREAREIAYIDYAGDALVWHHERLGNGMDALWHDLERVSEWRRTNQLDMVEVIRKKRLEERG